MSEYCCWTILILFAVTGREPVTGKAQDSNFSSWPGGKVPYRVAKSISRAETQQIKKALQLVTSLTSGCVSFLYRTTEMDYVRFEKNTSECASFVGRLGGYQAITLTGKCLQEPREIIHQMMHTLGFYHEHNREDRAQYVTINWNNIAPDSRDEFSISHTDPFRLPYDYESVTHYPVDACALRQNLYTIVPHRKGVPIGQQENLSLLDIAKIKMLYHCYPYEVLLDAGSDVAETLHNFPKEVYSGAVFPNKTLNQSAFLSLRGLDPSR